MKRGSNRLGEEGVSIGLLLSPSQLQVLSPLRLVWQFHQALSQVYKRHLRRQRHISCTSTHPRFGAARMANHIVDTCAIFSDSKQLRCTVFALWIHSVPQVRAWVRFSWFASFPSSTPSLRVFEVQPPFPALSCSPQESVES